MSSLFDATGASIGSCCLVVVESTSHWAPTVRAALASRGVRVVECRSLTECGLWLREFPWSVVAIQIASENNDQALSFLRNLRDQYPSARAVGLVPVERADLELLVREAGAVDAFSSLLESERLVRLVLRQAAVAPRQPSSIATLFQERWPWSAAIDPGPGGGD